MAEFLVECYVSGADGAAVGRSRAPAPTAAAVLADMQPIRKEHEQ